MKYPAMVAALAFLVLTACSGAPSEQDNLSPSSATFTVAPDSGKVILYAVYDIPDDRPYLNETFTVHSDNGDVADFKVDQYVEMNMPNGDYNFKVEEISGYNTSLNHSALLLHVNDSQLIYLSETIMHDGKVVLAIADPARGKQEVMARKRMCYCQSELRRFINSL